jgi:hypothetical protein
MPYLSALGLLLAKVESSYGTDPTPTKTANNIAVIGNVTVEPDVDTLERPILHGDFARSTGQTAFPRAVIRFQTELRGNRTNGTDADISAGASGNAIEINPLFQACDFEPTYTAEVSSGSRDGQVQYRRAVPSGGGVGSSVTFHFYAGGKLHKVTGAKGTFQLALAVGQSGKVNWTFTGFYSVSDASIPADPTWLNTMPPLFVYNGATALCTWGAVSTHVLASLNVDAANQVSRRDDAASATGIKGFIVTNHSPTASLDLEAVVEGTHAIYAALLAGTSQALDVVWGAQTGNQVAIHLETMISRQRFADRGGLITSPVDLLVRRTELDDALGDEFTITFS